MDNNGFDKAVNDHYNQIVNNYELVENHYVDEIEYTFNHKETGEPYIRVHYAEMDSMIDVRLLSLKAACLVEKTSEQTLGDFAHLSVEDLVDCIAYIDIPGDPDFYYNAKLSNKNLAIFKVGTDKGLQVKLIALIAEVQLALKFAGLVYTKNK